LARDEKCQGLPETTRRALINARIGQGGYRQRMLKVWQGRCAVTGLGIQDALTASHAMAWKDCDNMERLDEYNGLLLSATVDRLFDRGLISFSDTGRLLVRGGLDMDELRVAGLTTSSCLRHVPERCLPYWAAHRRRFAFEA
jgi:predicted restriction endonuclease